MASLTCLVIGLLSAGQGDVSGPCVAFHWTGLGLCTWCPQDPEEWCLRLLETLEVTQHHFRYIL